MAHCRLGEPARLREVTDACFALRLCSDEAQQSKAAGVSKRLEDPGELFGVDLVQSGPEDRSTAGPGARRHVAILTCVDVLCNIEACRYRDVRRFRWPLPPNVIALERDALAGLHIDN